MDIYHLASSKNFGRRVASFSAFLLTFITYILTLEHDASFWDCPEYLVTAARLEIGHPPGNPVWTLTARIFSLFGGSDPQAIATAVNLSSALFSALAVGILASCIFLILNHIFPNRGKRKAYGAFDSSRLRIPLLTLTSLCGALCFGWSDSVWFSAVEAEVYAMSLFLTALSLRLMLGWAIRRNRLAARRQLLLIVYLTGLSIGVHQLNLLVIPALALIWLFRRRRGRPGPGRIIAVLAISMGAVGAILLGMMPGVIKLAGLTELFCVNTLRLPFHSGVWAFWGVALAICWSLPLLLRRIKPMVSYRWVMLAWIPAMLLTGYSSYMLILVRGAANPPMNEGAPTNIFSLASYLGRDQYGSTPLFYGRTPYSRPMRQEKILADGSADYSTLATNIKSPRYLPAPADSTDSDRYLLYDHAKDIIYTPELNMLLPRITSSNPSDISCYADWAGMTSATMKEVEVSYALDSLGNPVGKMGTDGKRIREKELRPTYLQNLRYLGAYQIYYMYIRYLLWNYAGRQNDRFATGEVEHANFITGIPALDDAMLGPQSKLPDEIGTGNAGVHRFFLLPLLIGICGICFLQKAGRRGRRANLVILLLFFMTGLAIVLYLNQSPREPRERDYSFLGSFWAYAIWIGAGLFCLVRSAFNLKNKQARRIFTTISAAGSILLPIWMLIENYPDHDRSGRRGVTDFAANFLESLEPGAILFTNGDNYTFPLWWAQEVAGIRRDVTIINTAYLVTPWYFSQLMQPTAQAPGLITQARRDDILYGDFNFSRYEKSELMPSHEDSLSAVDAIAALRARYADPKGYRFPKMLRIYNPEGGDSILVRSSAVASGASTMNLKQLATLDILASNAAAKAPRPVYWLSMLPSPDFGGVYPFTTRTLHTRRLVYSDSLSEQRLNALLDLDMAAALATRSGRIHSGNGDDESDFTHLGPTSRNIYVDPTLGSMITFQRLGLLRLGGRLLSAGRLEDANAVAINTMKQFPFCDWEFQILYESDSICNEGIDLALLFIRSGDHQRGIPLLERERNRLRQWQQYRRALPARYRNVMTPKNIRKSTQPDMVDSLLNLYRPRRSADALNKSKN